MTFHIKTWPRIACVHLIFLPFLSWWVWLVVCQFCLSSQPDFNFISLCYCFFHLLLFIVSFHLLLLWSYLLLTLGIFCSFSSCFRYRVRLSNLCFSFFLGWGCTAINLPLVTIFGEIHRFWVIVFSLSFVSRNLFISLFISSVTASLFSNVLSNLREFVFFAVFFH